MSDRNPDHVLGVLVKIAYMAGALSIDSRRRLHQAPDRCQMAPLAFNAVLVGGTQALNIVRYRRTARAPSPAVRSLLVVLVPRSNRRSRGA
jgi:hypothetical protein